LDDFPVAAARSFDRGRVIRRPLEHYLFIITATIRAVCLAGLIDNKGLGAGLAVNYRISDKGIPAVIGGRDIAHHVLVIIIAFGILGHGAEDISGKKS